MGGQVMKLFKLAPGLHRSHRLGYEGRHVMLPLTVLSLMALAVYIGTRSFNMLVISRNALFYVVMAFVALGIAGLFGMVSAWLHSEHENKDTNEGFCFVGALIGALIFYIALLF